MTPPHQFSGQKILVTGASGFIGPHLCRKLCKNGADVHAVSRMKYSGGGNCPSWWQSDLTEFESVRKLLDAIRPDIIFHLSGHAAGGRGLELVLPTFHSNLTTTVNLLTVATEIGCRRIILPGSLEEPDSGNEIPSSPYAAGKCAASAYARMFHELYKSPIVILRLFMAYGPGKQSPRKLLPYVVTSLLKGETPKLSSGERRIDWIYIDDVVDGMIAAAEAPDVEGRTIDLGSGVLVSIRDIVQQLAKMIEPKLNPLFGDIPERPMEQVRVANVDETYARIAWRPAVPLDKGLEYTVSWYREQLKGSREVLS